MWAAQLLLIRHQMHLALWPLRPPAYRQYVDVPIRVRSGSSWVVEAARSRRGWIAITGSTPLSLRLSTLEEDYPLAEATTNIRLTRTRACIPRGLQGYARLEAHQGFTELSMLLLRYLRERSYSI